VFLHVGVFDYQHVNDRGYGNSLEAPKTMNMQSAMNAPTSGVRPHVPPKLVMMFAALTVSMCISKVRNVIRFMDSPKPASLSPSSFPAKGRLCQVPPSGFK
jgi:hypothetical protein